MERTRTYSFETVNFPLNLLSPRVTTTQRFFFCFRCAILHLREREKKLVMLLYHSVCIVGAAP